MLSSRDVNLSILLTVCLFLFFSGDDYAADIWRSTAIPNLHAVDVPVEQRMEYNHTVENVFRAANETDQKLQMVVAVLQKEDIVRKLIAIVSFQFFLYIFS